MNFSEAEDGNILVSHIMTGLVKELLVAERFGTGTGRFMRQRKSTTGFHDEPALSIVPTLPGVELFLWAHGKSDMSFVSFFDPATQFELNSDISIPAGHYRPTG